jgi:phytanoyl-CoA hydroxylase
MHQLTRGGLSCEVPDDYSTSAFDTDQLEEAVQFYHDYGYVVIKNVFAISDCEKLKQAWSEEIKKSDQPIYRQATAELEKNIFNDSNHVVNPILNLQSLNPKRFPRLRAYFEQIVLSNQVIGSISSKVYADNRKPTVVQSMYFEGNSVTWEHQDSFYLDGGQIGSLMGVWIALESINELAGRFWVAPRTHRYDFSEPSAEVNVATGHSQYINLIRQRLTTNKGTNLVAPFLDEGDILLWNSLTVHGSLRTIDPSYSRNSITLHIIPGDNIFRRLRGKPTRLKIIPTSHALNVFRPKDQAKYCNRLTYLCEKSLGRSFYALKKMAILLKLYLSKAIKS